MKKLIIAICALCMSFVVGCKSIPSDSNLSKIAHTAGVTAAVVVNHTIDIDTKTAIVEVVTRVNSVIPAENETYSTAWNTLIDKHVDDLVVENKIQPTNAECVKAMTKYLTKAMDYLETNYPAIATRADTMQLVIRNMTDGFLSKLQTTALEASQDIDIDLFNFLTK